MNSKSVDRTSTVAGRIVGDRRNGRRRRRPRGGHPGQRCGPSLAGRAPDGARLSGLGRRDRQHFRPDRPDRASTIMTGSHLDSQPRGGRLDGAYGVLASLLAAHDVAARGNCGKGLVVVAWTGEEGARFQPSLVGSSVYAGTRALDWTLARRDGQGISVAEALDAIGFRGTDPAPPRLPPMSSCMSSVLPNWSAAAAGSACSTPGGARTSWRSRSPALPPIPAPRRWHSARTRCCRSEGRDPPAPDGRPRQARRAAHLGRPPRGRAELAQRRAGPGRAVRRAALGQPRYHGPRPRLARPRADPGLRRARRRGQDPARRTASARSLRTGPAPARRATATALGEEPLPLATIAAHDAMPLATVCAHRVVIAVPSREGLCHSPREWTDPADLRLGLAWLTAMLERLART